MFFSLTETSNTLRVQKTLLSVLFKNVIVIPRVFITALNVFHPETHQYKSLKPKTEIKI
jgi:hypothetical protein